MSTPSQIDFHKIAPRNGSQPDAFEEFCCQIARHTPHKPVDATFIRYRGAGGDGGVECVWRIVSGEEWGWQVKYIFDFDRAMDDLGQSFKTAIKIHPKLTRYVMCIPFDLTGPTGRKTKTGTSAKNQRERFDEYKATWEAYAKECGVNVLIELATSTTLLDDLLTFDRDGGRLHFWFDSTILGDDWFAEHLLDMKRSAGPRYTPKLSIETPVADAFEALGQTDDWRAILDAKTQTIRKHLEEWEVTVSHTEDGPWQAVFPAHLCIEGERAKDTLQQLHELVRKLSETGGSPTEIATVRSCVSDVLADFRALHIKLASDLEEKHGAGAVSSAHFRQTEAEYNVSFPAANLDKTKEIAKYIAVLNTWLSSQVAQILGMTGIMLIGPAGIGKTHAICDTAESRATQGLRTIIVFAERLNGTQEPWEQIHTRLGFKGDLGWPAMLAALNAAGEASGRLLLLCIDGLNETKPRPYWPNHLSALVSQISRYEWLRLCVSCRSTYETQVMPDPVPGLSLFTHPGFAGQEFNASREFFQFYDLEPPMAPVLHTEFSNPLFLRLICTAMKKAGIQHLPSGWHGLNTAIKGFMEAQNDAYARQFGSLLQHRIPERALKAFVAETEAQRTSALPIDTALTIIEGVLPKPHADGYLTDWLVREGTLIVDAAPTRDEEGAETVRIAFERLGDHLLADRLISGLTKETAQTAFDPGGALAFLVENTHLREEYLGVLEALAIQLPERFDTELPYCSSDLDLQEELMKLTVTTLPWRDVQLLSDRTLAIIQTALSFNGFSKQVFSNVLSIAVHQSSLDAYWLHVVLKTASMARRDAFWTKFLHQSYEERGPVYRLLEAGFEIEPETLTEDIRLRWALCLLWFCAAADRRIRDIATKALVRLTKSAPLCWRTLIELAAGIDDEYIVERALVASYGCLLCSRDKAAEEAIARVVYDTFFTDTTRYQNALIRDHARSILELAQHDGVLPDIVVQANYLPPYQSEWPLSVPSEADIKALGESGEKRPKLYFSCLHDDFFTYTLTCLRNYEYALRRPAMGRWIFKHTLDMGYSGQYHGDYDNYMLYTYGGGRSRPEWADRIGKKYQLIGLARLAARLSDHIKPKREWGNTKFLRTPLTYPDGRDIDPSLLLRKSANEKTTAWWMPVRYDFDAVAALNDKDWTRTHDMPDSSEILTEHSDGSGQNWLMLEGFLDWNSHNLEEIDHPSRRIWMQVRSYLISQSMVNRCWAWLQNQQFFGRWMPEGIHYSEGFIGEYPWATMFNLYKEEPNVSRSNKMPPCKMHATSNHLSVTGDASQETGMNFFVPARRFFEYKPLRWNGDGNFILEDGTCAFMDPSNREPGPSSLLVTPVYLQDYLTRHKFALVWTILGEKLILGDHERARHRLTYSRTHILSAKGMLSSTAVAEND